MEYWAQLHNIVMLLISWEQAQWDSYYTENIVAVVWGSDENLPGNQLLQDPSHSRWMRSSLIYLYKKTKKSGFYS